LFVVQLKEGRTMKTLFDDEPTGVDVRESIERDIQAELDRAAKRRARATDPETSKLAAAHVTGHLGDIQRWALEIVKAYPGSTASELADVKGIGDPRQINRRLPELEELGRVRRGEARECQITGRKAATWYAT
jgi:predicted transcriptional regulator